MTPPPWEPNYVPSPQPNRIYSGPDVPVTYDSNWQLFTNLTPDQIAWFQSQPEWQQFLQWVALAPEKAVINAHVDKTTIATAISASQVVG